MYNISIYKYIFDNCHHFTNNDNIYINIMSNTETFELQNLAQEEHNSYQIESSGAIQLCYTLFAGSAVCLRLKIQKCGYRLIKSKNNNSKSQLVLINKVEDIGSNTIKAPLNIIRKYGTEVTLSRVNLSIASINNNIVPKLAEAKQLYIYINSSSIFVDLIKEIVNKQVFIVSTKRQEVYLHLSWFQSQQSMKQLKSSNHLHYRRAIAENKVGKITNFLRLNMKGILENEQLQKYSSCLFVPNKTKVQLQMASHYDLNQVIKIIKLPHLYQMMFNNPSYIKLKDQLMNIIQYKPQKKIILLKIVEGVGLSSFLHNLAQLNDYNFVKINCKYFASQKQLNEKIKTIQSYDSSFIYIKDIQWLLQVGSDKNDVQEKMKRTIRSLEQAFYNMGDHSLTSHIIVIGFKGNSIKFDMTKNADLLKFEVSKEQRLESLRLVTQYFKKQNIVQLQDSQQVLNVATNSLGWVKFSKILKQIKQLNPNDKKKKTEKVLGQIGKIVSMEKVQNIKNVSWADVGGLQDAKEQIIQTILLPTKHPQIFDEWIKPRTGLLFYGPPGTGKTLLGKCIANQCKMGFISVKGPELLNMYIGESEKNVRQVFQRAAASKPCIVFMDQLDALIPKRGQSSDSNQVMDRIVSQLLTQMDKAPSNGIFVIGATNRPDLLDPSILRPGRFDKQIYLGIRKDKQSRIQILKAQTRNIKLKQGFNYQRVVDSVPENFTGADFYGLTSRSITKAAQRYIEELQNQIKDGTQDVIVTEQDFIQTSKQIKPSVSVQQLSHYQKLKQQYK